MHVGGLLTFGLPEDAEPDHLSGIAAALRAQTGLVAPWNLRLQTRGLARVAPAWVEVADIDMDYHFRHSALPQPGGERELGVLVSRLHSHPLDHTRPLWEIHLIEGLENNRFAIYFKIHHSLIDGLSGMQMVLQILSDTADPARVVAPWTIGPRRRDSGQTGSKPPALLAAVAPSALLASTRGFASGLSHLASISSRDDEPLSPYSAPRSLLDGPMNAQRRLATQQVSLAEVRSCAAAVGGTINDVVLWLCATALRRFLDEAGELPEQGLTTAVAVGLREDGDESVGSNIAMIYVSLATDQAEPNARMRTIRASSKAGKQHLRDIPKASRAAYSAANAGPFLLSQLTHLDGFLPPMFNLGISNVPGPKQAQYLADAQLEAIYPVSLLMRGGALNVTCVSYDGRLCFGFTGARDTLPHLQRLAVYLGEAATEMGALDVAT